MQLLFLGSVLSFVLALKYTELPLFVGYSGTKEDSTIVESRNPSDLEVQFSLHSVSEFGCFDLKSEGILKWFLKTLDKRKLFLTSSSRHFCIFPGDLVDTQGITKFLLQVSSSHEEFVSITGIKGKSLSEKSTGFLRVPSNVVRYFGIKIKPDDYPVYVGMGRDLSATAKPDESSVELFKVNDDQQVVPLREPAMLPKGFLLQQPLHAEETFYVLKIKGPQEPSSADYLRYIIIRNSRLFHFNLQLSQDSQGIRQKKYTTINCMGNATFCWMCWSSLFISLFLHWFFSWSRKTCRKETIQPLSTLQSTKV